MLNVTENIKAKLLGEPLASYKILNLGGNEVYVMGITKIVKFQENEIVVKLKNKELFLIKGSEMFLKQISDGGILISGKIRATEII